jgi:hypothetical protein
LEPSRQPTSLTVTQSSRRIYEAPKLTRFGDVRVLTQAGPSGTAETLNNGTGKCKADGTKTCVPSDRSIKKDITRIGDHPLGFGVYLFNYKPGFQGEYGQGRQFGVIADEVANVVPEAVITTESGIQHVDYAMIGVHPQGAEIPAL